MVAVLLSQPETLLANFFWMWGGPVQLALLFVAALFTDLGDEYRDREW
jgi:hypothetical protein